MEPLKDPPQDDGNVLQRHRHRDKHRSTSEKHREKESKPSKHKHKHHKHKHRKRRRKENEDVIYDEIGSGDDEPDDGTGGISDLNRPSDAAQASQAENSASPNCGKVSADSFPLGAIYLDDAQLSLSDNFHPDNTSMEGVQSLPRGIFFPDNAINETHTKVYQSLSKADIMGSERHSVENTVDTVLISSTVFFYSHEGQQLQGSERSNDAAVQETGKPSEDEKEEGEILDSDVESGEIASGNRMNGERETIENCKQLSSRQAYSMLDDGEGDARADQAFQNIQNIDSTYDSDQGSQGVATDRKQKCVNTSILAYDDSLTLGHTATQPGEYSTDDTDAKRQSKRKRSELLIDVEEGNLKSFSSHDELAQSLQGADDPSTEQKCLPSDLRSGDDDSAKSLHEHEIQAKADSDGLSYRRLTNAQEKRERDRQSRSKEDVNRRDRRSRSRELLSDSRHRKDKGNREKRLRSREDGYSELEQRRSQSRELGAYDYSKRSERTSRSRSRENNYDYGSAKDRYLKGISERARRSESREAGPDCKYAKDTQDGYERDRRSRSREAGPDCKYTKDTQDGYECDRRSRSREAVGASKHAGCEWYTWSKFRETTSEIRPAKDNYPEIERARRSRSKETDYHLRHARDNHRCWMSRDTIIHRKRSLSRDHKDSLDRRWSRRSASSDCRGDIERKRRSISRDWRDSPDRRRRRRSMSRNRRDTPERMRRRLYSRDHGGSFDRRRRSASRDRRSRSRDSWRERRKEWDKKWHSSSIDDQGNAGEVIPNSKNTSAGLRLDEDEDIGDLHVAAEEDELEKFKEESRKRRQAIVEKYKALQQTKHEETSEGVEGKMAAAVNSGQGAASEDPKPISVENDLVDADDLKTESMSFDLGKVPPHDVSSLISIVPGTGGLGEGTPKSEKSYDIVCDYIFGESPAGGRKLSKGDGLALETSCLTDNWDDAEGYYCYRIGEVLDARYEIAASHGRGVFSSVVRARDLKATHGEPEEVAIKIIRNNDLMFKSGQQELVILKKLVGADPENRRHCVRFLSSFEYRNHLCLVFESLHMNLREILKKFGRNIGINLNAVRAYAKQLLIALKHLRNCGVLHCDIKPDNMLVNEAKNVLKLCDFGSAMFAGENEITPYLVSRFYRAPEIILGLPYDHALDMWSVGCCLYEFYTGKVLFPGPTNNDMLKLHMELKGPFPKKMLRKAGFASKHFDQDFNFCAVEEDSVTKTTVKRVLVNIKPKDIGSLVSGIGTPNEDPKMLANFKDLLEKIFILDPDKRLTVSQALNHAFITGK